jgi:uncharacterized protein (DUF2336 family)
MRYDPQAVMQAAGLTKKAKALRARVLLLGGSKSPDYLRVALDSLQASLPEASRVELRGVGHLAPDDGGSPQRVAHELKTFLLRQRNK